MLVLVLSGPTAVGKSDLGLQLARRLGGEILCADSMQVYRLLDIGTAKPTAAERAQVPHHLLDLVYPDEPFSAAQYAEACREAIGRVHALGRLPIVIGGTGLYIRAALRPFLFPDAGGRPELRARLQTFAEANGPAALHARLQTLDPDAAARIHPHDVRRVIRALEVQEATGRPISAWQREAEGSSPYDLIHLCLTREREELYERIEARTECMLAEGFTEEVGRLLQAGYGRQLPPMQGLGYRELAAHLQGDCPLPEAVATIKQRTRHYAKRQLTWFRHERDVHWLNLTSRQKEWAIEEILSLLAGRWKDSSNISEQPDICT